MKAIEIYKSRLGLIVENKWMPSLPTNSTDLEKALYFNILKTTYACLTYKKNLTLDFFILKAYYPEANMPVNKELVNRIWGGHKRGVRSKTFPHSIKANQEFTHIATPEENSYIEAFHSIIQREVIERYEFTGYYDAKQTLFAHIIWYDTRRFHKAIKMTPNEKWNQNIHITNQKRNEQNLSENLNNKNDEENQNYQYLSQILNTKTTNYYTTVSTKVSK